MMKPENTFPDAIKRQPRAASSASDNLSGWVADMNKSQVVFWEVAKGFEVEPHVHAHDEYGVVLSGYCEVIINGVTSRYSAGDEFYIPGNVSHAAVMSDNYRALDFFESPDWIKIIK